jgi:6-phosphogluconolactonase
MTMPFDLISFPDANSLAKRVAEKWLYELAKCAGNPAPYTVALSGGRITRTFYSELTRQVEKQPETLSLVQTVHYFWGDERCVPPGDPESNYNLARELLFEPLKVPEAQIHRIKGEAPEPLALKEAIADICSVAKRQEGTALPVLDMIFLGMGEDGHTASLFPEEPPEAVSDPAICRAVTAVKPPPRRITLGYPVLAVASAVWVFASGKGKERALAESILPSGVTPLARVLQSRSSLETKIFTDIAPH